MSRERTMTQYGSAVVVMHPNRARRRGADTRLRDQQQLSGAAAGFEVLVRLPGLVERVAAADAHVERAVGDPIQDVTGALFELVSGRDVLREAGAGEVERLGLQLLRVP